MYLKVQYQRCELTDLEISESLVNGVGVDFILKNRELTDLERLIQNWY